MVKMESYRIDYKYKEKCRIQITQSDFFLTRAKSKEDAIGIFTNEIKNNKTHIFFNLECHKTGSK